MEFGVYYIDALNTECMISDCGDICWGFLF